jgi:hypothetical protein
MTGSTATLTFILGIHTTYVSRRQKVLAALGGHPKKAGRFAFREKRKEQDK